MKTFGTLSTLALLILLTTPHPASGEDIEVGERAYMYELKQAKEKLDAAEKAEAKGKSALEEAAAALVKAKEGVDKAAKARDEAYRKWEVAKNASSTATESLDAKIRDTETEIAADQELIKQGGEAERIASLEREVKFLEYSLAKLRSKRDKAAADSATPAAALDKLKSAYNDADKGFWEANRSLWNADSAVQFKEDKLGELALETAEARKAYLDVRVRAPQKLVRYQPPFLCAVTATNGTAKVYEAAWVSEEEILDQRIEFMRKAIEDQMATLKRQSERKTLFFNDYLAAGKDSQSKIKAYEEAIWSQAYKAIALDIGESALSVAYDIGIKGDPALVAFGAQLFDKIYDGCIGNSISQRYHLPSDAPAADPPRPFSNAARRSNAWSAVTSKQKELYYSVIKQTVEGASRLAPEGARKVFKVELTEKDAWAKIKQEVLSARNAVSKEVFIQYFRDLSAAEIKKSLREKLPAAIAQGLRKSLENFKKNGIKGNVGAGGKFIGHQVVGFMKDFVKNEMGDALRRERITVWQNYLEAAAWETSLNDHYEMEFKMWRSEQVHLEAYQQYLKTLLDERDRILNRRRLVVTKDEIASDSKGPLDLSLTFSGDVEEVKVTLDGKDLQGKTSGAAWTSQTSLKEMKGEIARLKVEARDPLTKKVLHTDPGQVPHFDSVEAQWLDYRPGADDHHRIKLKELKPGISLVILVDCSGSMADYNRMANAKAAAQKVLTSESFPPDTECALWSFANRGDIRLIQPFSRDLKSVAAAVQTLAPQGATPLAEGIRRAGAYAMTQSRNAQKVLVVLSDGEETCNGDPKEAAMAVQKSGVTIKNGGN